MKLSAILIGILAACAAAHVVRSSEPMPQPQGIDGLQNYINQITEFPGIGAIQRIVTCIRKDPTWKADYSDQKNGKITFSSVTKKCCDKANAGWTKYRDSWSKFAKASFNAPCDGGQLSNMTEDNIDKIHAIIGSGH